MSKRNKWIVGISAVLILGIAAGWIALRTLRGRVEPVLKEQIVQRLSDDFDADVDVEGLNIQLLPTGRWFDATARVRLDGITIRRKGEPDEKPELALRRIGFDVNARDVLRGQGRIPTVDIDGLDIDVPPKPERSSSPLARVGSSGRSHPKISVSEVRVTNAHLTIRPVDPSKHPLDFDIQRMQLWIDGSDRPIHYVASLTNPRPPGQIEARGLFGPWSNDDPGTSPLAGTYDFQNADLGVFQEIAGTLHSTGSFTGQLSHVEAQGEADVPNFRLRTANHPVPLKTQFTALVDGRNGDTILRPVRAQLGGSRFTTSGAVVKLDPDSGRTIDLTTHVPAGRVRDFMSLAMGGTPLMDGILSLDAKVQIPPLSKKVQQKLQIQAKFAIRQGMFLKSDIEQRLTDLSHRSEGQPKSPDTDQAVSEMSGTFVMQNDTIQFSELTFGVPGMDVSLTGLYDLGNESIDFHGTARLQAKLSQTQTSYKRWLLKPIDPFFAKDGAGAVLPVRIEGTRTAPKFGLDLHRKKDKE